MFPLKKKTVQGRLRFPSVCLCNEERKGPNTTSRIDQTILPNGWNTLVAMQRKRVLMLSGIDDNDCVLFVAFQTLSCYSVLAN